MLYDTHGNFAYAKVAIAPSVPLSGTTLSLLNADADFFPDPQSPGNAPYNLTDYAANQNALSTNSEVIRITAKGAHDSGGTGYTQFTIQRLQEQNVPGNMSARSIQVGDQIANNVTEKWWTDIEMNKLDRDGTQAMTGHLTFTGTNHAGLQLNSLTTTQVNALTPTNGMVLYNSTLNQINKYENSQWTDISKSPATKVIAPAGSGYAADIYTTGTADDVAIQAILNSMGGGVLEFVGYTTSTPLNITAKIQVPNNTTIKGNGWNTIFQLGNSINDTIFANSGSVNIHFLDFAIDMNSANNTTINGKGGVKITGALDSSIERVKVTNLRHVQGQHNVGVSLTTCSNSVIKNCYIYNVGDYGIATNGLLQCQIIDNYIQNPAGHGIDMELGTISSANERNIGCTIARNTIFYDASETLTNQDGIKIGRCDGCIISNNTIYCTLENGKLGFYYAEDVAATGDNNFDSGNIFSNNTIYGFGQGLWLLGSLNDVIATNTITLPATAAYGMQITVSTDPTNPTASEEMQITGNTIIQKTNTVQTSGGGITIYGNAHHINVSGNNIFNVTNTGIQVVFGCKNISIVGNTIRDSMASAIHIGCSFGTAGRNATGASYNTVSGNNISGSSRISDTTYNDIEIWGASTYNGVVGNTINCPNANRSKFGVHEDGASGTPDNNNIANNTIQGVSNGVLTVNIVGTATIASGNSNGGRGFEIIQMSTSGSQIRLFDNRSGISNPIKTLRSRGGNFQIIDNSANNALLTIQDNGRIGSYNITSPTAWLHLPAGAATASGAPLKFTSGVLLTTPEDGAVNYDGSHLYFTIGSTRYQIDQQVTSVTAVTSLAGTANQVLVNGTSGVATDGAITLTTPQSIATSSSPTFAGLSLTGNLTYTTGLQSQQASYTIFISGSTYKAQNGSTNAIDYSGTNLYTVFNSVLGALTSGGDIFVRAGTYTTATEINISTSNITVDGEGAATIFTAANSANIRSIIAVTGSTTNVKLRNFVIDGNKTAQTSGNGIYIKNSSASIDSDYVLEDILIQNCKNDGLKIDTGNANGSMYFLRVHSRTNNGSGFNDLAVSDSVFDQCISETNALHGFYVGGVDDHYSNCKAFYNGSATGNYHGYYVAGFNNYFDTCEAQDNYQSGFYTQNDGDATYGAQNCTFVNCSADSNNQSSNASYGVGFQIKNTKGWVLIGCQAFVRPYATFTQRLGVSLEGTTSQTQITNLQGSGNSTALYSNTASGPGNIFFGMNSSGTRAIIDGGSNDYEWDNVPELFWNQANPNISLYSASNQTLNIINGGGGQANLSVQNNLSIGGVETITSTSSSALAVGANGATNPALKIDASTASSITGLKVKSAASGGGIALSVISSFTDEAFNIDALGSGALNLNVSNGSSVNIGGATTIESTLLVQGGTNITTGNTYKINGTTVLSNNTLGSGVVTSSLTSVGTIGTGVWQGTLIGATYGGTGINNGSNNLTVPATGTAALIGLAQTFTAAQVMTIASAGNAVPLTINQNDTTNNPTALLISNTGSGVSLDILAPNIAANGVGNLRIYSSTSQNTDTGGSISLGGYITGTSASQVHGAISARKENNTSANTRSYMRFDVAGSERMRIDSNGQLGFGGAPAASQYVYTLTFVTTANKTIGMERMVTAATAGKSLTISAQSAKSGGTDLAGGSLIFQSGIATGTGSGIMQFQTSKAQGSTNTTDNALATTMTLDGTGNLRIGDATAPTATLDLLGKYLVNSSGLNTKYNNITTVSNGIPSIVATIDSTGLTANVGATTLYAVPASGVGMYRVSTYVVETTAGSLSSTLPNVQIVFTDNDSNTSITIDATPILGVAGIGQTGALTANTVGTASSGVIVIYVKASTTIQYQTVNYASNLAGMAYALRIKLEAL